jgi:hypothetical protein
MKIVFLDVDGVLNILGDTYRSCHYHNLGNDPIERHLMVRLEFIMERVPDAKIVISSAWGNKQLISRLSRLRFKYLDRIIGRTPRSKRYRGQQIKEWLDDNAWQDPNTIVTSFVVLEDEVSDVCGSKCSDIKKELVVEVDMNEGLSNKNTIQAVQILNDLEHKTLDEYILDSTIYDIFYNQGYRPSVGGTKEELLGRWEKMVLITETLTMNMVGRKDDE